MTEIIERFERYLMGEKRSYNTIKEYRSIVKNFLNFINKDPEDITQDDIEKYREYMAIEKKYSKQTIYLSMKALQVFFRYARRDDLTRLKAPKRSRKLPNYLNENEMRSLLESSKSNIRDYAIIMVLAYSGIRVSELCSLRIEDVDFSENVIHVKSGKGDKDRMVVVDSRVMEVLKEYLRNEKRNEGYVFMSRKRTRITPTHVERIVRYYAGKAGINKKVTPHVIRHTFATALLRNGADIRFIQQILGHSSVATTQIYTHVNDEVLKEVYERTKPHY
ncbi:MAG: site-specific tyrosine recombinase/integron integrase [Thermoplasmata archaeon]|jgi:integrase/recombinase XerD|nr:tyrosine-type recombinase/integrase [Thermoplasmatales archaeon]